MFDWSVRAPEFPVDAAWLNVERPLRVHGELRGRVTVLDFWTFCCINCMHVLPDLAYLEAKYAHDPVAFIGVHSAKYTNEASPDNVREAILRYGIHHPVVVDADHRIWDAYAVHAWPTLVVIDAEGMIVGAFSGEGHREEMDRVIAALLELGRERGALAEGPLPLRPEPPHVSSSGLLFPGKVLADAHKRRLFIADSGHHRIIVTDWEGRVQAFFGSGVPGLMDGAYEDARFHNPQGMALLGNSLYVADTDNHAIRRADLLGYHVDTVLGNGMIGYDRRGGHSGRDQALNSPWDLAMLGGKLYLAMAGLHQIWVFDPTTGEAHVVAGTGRENITDGPARRAALAQPSGIAAAGEMLYFADSETSAVRSFDPHAETITTLVGEGLFTFGDADGPGARARLQHPLGVAATPDALYVADSYNHRIKRIDLRDGAVHGVVGQGTPARLVDTALAFSEPGGLSVAGHDLFIADTNNDRVIHFDLQTGAWREIIPNLGGQPLAEAA